MKRNNKRRTSLAAFLLVILFAGASDGLMEMLGPDGFLAVGMPVMALAWRLSEPKETLWVKSKEEHK